MVISWLTYICLFLVAVLYASVGLGGATGYLAVFTLFGVTDPLLAPTVLLLNIFVAGLSFLAYYREGHFNRDLLWPFVVTSIPAAFVGGMIPLDERMFSTLLGAALLVAGVRMLIPGEREPSEGLDHGLPVTLTAGVLLGLIAGLTGSGGGFLLIPVLIVFLGTEPKQAAVTAAAFVIVNSLTGFGGHFVRGHYTLQGVVPLIVVVGAGGFLGSRLGAQLFKPEIVQRLISVVLLMAGAKLLFQNF